MASLKIYPSTITMSSNTNLGKAYGEFIVPYLLPHIGRETGILTFT